MGALITLASLVFAQQPGDFDIEAGPDLTKSDVPYSVESVGSPAVAYDPVQDRFIMVFESLLPTTDSRCPVGVWGLGLATSNDGETWTVASRSLIEPVPGDGTYYSCVAAHPTVIYNEVSENLQVWFKAEQDDDACASTTPAWGCDQYTGIGRARINFNATGGITGFLVSANPVVDVTTNFGYPSVVRQDGTFHMMYTRWSTTDSENGAYYLTGTTPTSWDTPPTTATIEVSDYNASLTWVEDEFFNAAMVCEDDPLFPLSVFIGGRDTSFSTVLSGGWGKAIFGGVTWVLAATPYFEWASDLEWRHWDVIRYGTSDYVVWFDEKNSSGDNEVFVATTVARPWTNSEFYTRDCP